jgi:hypothetical protein
MAGYMAVRGHGRRHNLEMTASTIGVGIVVIGLLWSGAVIALWAAAGLLIAARYFRWKPTGE